jgi:hypothetical protein
MIFVRKKYYLWLHEGGGDCSVSIYKFRVKVKKKGLCKQW